MCNIVAVIHSESPGVRKRKKSFVLGQNGRDGWQGSMQEDDRKPSTDGKT
jgi:hypothetical protein